MSLWTVRKEVFCTLSSTVLTLFWKFRSDWHCSVKFGMVRDKEKRISKGKGLLDCFCSPSEPFKLENKNSQVFERFSFISIILNSVCNEKSLSTTPPKKLPPAYALKTKQQCKIKCTTGVLCTRAKELLELICPDKRPSEIKCISSILSKSVHFSRTNF